MEIRKANKTDIPEILEIYESARNFMRKTGNMHQWTGGYPSRENVKSDMASGNLYVCIDSGETVGVFFFLIGEDITYNKIYGGEWQNDEPYGVIHRIAVKYSGRGIADFCYKYCFGKCPHLRVDTHKDNIPMQHSLLKNGFTYQGIIHLVSGDERLAYEK